MFLAPLGGAFGRIPYEACALADAGADAFTQQHGGRCGGDAARAQLRRGTLLAVRHALLKRRQPLEERCPGLGGISARWLAVPADNGAAEEHSAHSKAPLKQHELS